MHYSSRSARRHSSVVLASVAALALGIGFALGREGRAGETVTPLLSSSETILAEPIRYPASAPAKITAAVVELAPGAETGWHTHDVPTFGYMLEGELTVAYDGHGERIYRVGDGLLEAVDIRHNGRNTGAGPMRILVLFAGAEGLANTIPAAAPVPASSQPE